MRLCLVLVLVLCVPLHAQDGDTIPVEWLTIPERIAYQRTSTFAEVMAVIDALQAQTNLIHREQLLLTREGRDVPLLVLANPPVSSPEQARASGKPVIYIQGNIHGGEVEGKEASLVLMRDMLFGDKQHLLENQVVIFVPVYNADGNDDMAAENRPSQEMSPPLTGVRTAHGYDLNRDGVIQEADETRALFEKVILRWDPDLFVDLHTTNGTWHGYSLTYAPSYQTAGDPAPSAYTADVMLPAIRDAVKTKFNLDFNWYGGFDPLTWPPTEYRTYHHAPRYLTNNLALRNRMAILSETFAHDRFYKRIHAANAFIEEILEYTHVHGDEIRRINREADARVSAGQAGMDKGVQFEMAPLEESLDLLSYLHIPYINDAGEAAVTRSAEIVTVPGVQNYNRFQPRLTAPVPSSYIFSGALQPLAQKLQEQGIWVETLEADSFLDVDVFTVTSIDKQPFVQNGHRNSLLRGSFTSDNRNFSRGDYIVSMNQRLANLVFYLLEPQSDDGLAYWNLFDEVLEGELQRSGEAEYPVFKVR